MIDLWVATVPVDVAPCLSSTDVERTLEFVYELDRERWARARSIVRRVLAARYLSTCPEQIRFGTRPGGKPYIEDAPLDFNLSHSGDAVALAVSDSGPVGVDIEWHDPETDVAELASAVFHPDEMHFWQRSGLSRRIFYRMWCAKEAAAKAEGTGFLVDPRRFLTSRWNGDHCFVHGASQSWRAILAEEKGFTLCVAIPAAADPTVHRISIAGELERTRGFSEAVSCI